MTITNTQADTGARQAVCRRLSQSSLLSHALWRLGPGTCATSDPVVSDSAAGSRLRPAPALQLEGFSGPLPTTCVESGQVLLLPALPEVVDQALRIRPSRRLPNWELGLGGVIFLCH